MSDEQLENQIGSEPHPLFGDASPGAGAPRPARVLVIDDQPANLRLLEIILTDAGYIVECLDDPLKSCERYCSFRPDLVLVDLMMPVMDGFAVIKALKFEMCGEVFTPIVVLTSDISVEAKHRALRLGASDYLTKPFDEHEVLLRIGNLVHTRSQAVLLEHWVEARTVQLERAHLEIVERLALAAEFRDDATGQHTKRVGVMSNQIATALGWSGAKALLLAQAAQLHDIGKIGIPDRILLKPGPLTEEEFAIMKTHTEVGAMILVESTAPVLILAEEIVRYHHERWDGKGYYGLVGEAIPLSARIVCVADSYDAIISDRPYQGARQRLAAIEEIRRNSGTQFDPKVVEAFLTVMRETEA